ncbi:O-antigen ligase family protein [Litoricola sp.]|nr:O-antigen ligase family protein [Litorivicinus sp.]
MNFIAFSFVMFSCWFPTGFSATFSSLAFFFALPLFFYRVQWATIGLFEKAGLALFGWLSLSILWSQAGVLESLGYLSEYRIYFMVPVISVALRCLPATTKWSVVAALTGGIVALIASYGLGLGFWTIEGALYSMGAKIYHGFIMSTLMLVALLIARNMTGVHRAGFILLSILIAYNVLNIETGRTGYLQVIATILIFLGLTFGRKQAFILVVITAFSFGTAYWTLERFNGRVNETLANVERVFLSDDIRSSTGHRLEFYRGALKIAGENPLVGVGVGDVSSELANLAKKGEIRVTTDNVHSEFLNMLIAGGAPALFLFLGFVCSIVWTGVLNRRRDAAVGDALITLAAIVFISALFNSTIKDYGEKHALIIILSILASKVNFLPRREFIG